MAILSDRTIHSLIDSGELLVYPKPLDEQYQPASLDLRLDNDFILLNRMYCIKSTDKSFTIDPGGFILASTMEHIELPDYLVARVEGRSSIGRLGLMVHVTAGFIDPGFKGNITLEIKNIGNRPITISKGDRICQLAFEQLDYPCENSYNGHYQDQSGVTVSYITKDEFEL